MNPRQKAVGANITILTIVAAALIGVASITALSIISQPSSTSVNAFMSKTLLSEGTPITTTSTQTSLSVNTSTVTTETSNISGDAGFVQVLSVVGPIPPYNPGGPAVSVTLENTGDTSIVSLNATISLTEVSSSTGSVHPLYQFYFNVRSTNPLLSGQTTQDNETLLGAGFQTDASYPLTIHGITASGTEFSYTIQVQIQPPDA